MEALATYLIKSSVWLTGFALVYAFFLRDERFFVLNRIYLISGILISIIFPFFTWHYTVLLPVVPTTEVFEPQIQGIAEVSEPFPLQNVLLLSLYISGIIYLGYRILRQTLPVFRIIRKSEIHSFSSAKLIRTAEYPASFSFFSFVFVNPSIDEIETREIVNHELEHIRQQHWIDLLLFEILRTVQWFNPAIWLYGHLIRQNHEYLADERALQRSSNPAIYRAALLNQMFGGPVISLANSFNYSLNKKRFNMMKQTISSPIRKLKLLLVLPLIAGVFYAFAAPEYKFIQTDELATNSTQNERTVKGKVTDENGKPLKSASVVISGKTIGTITDDNGNFMLKVTDDSPIVVSYVGFDSQKVTLDFEKEMLITMKTTTIGIEAMGNEIATSKPSEIPNNVLYIVDGKEIPKDEIEKIIPQNIDHIDVLKNKTAVEKYGEKGKDGVVLITTKKAKSNSGEVTVVGYETNPNNQVKSGVQLRTTGGNVPLIVKDGIVSPNLKMDDINPNDIESINVLKGESAIAKYGEKGKNGVLEIAIKKPNPVFSMVEEMPQFPGGFEALKTYVAASMKYPTIALENVIQGQVTVKFVVDKSGKVTNTRVSRSVDPSIDKEALRIVNSLPKWEPGKQNGEAVDVSYEMPINFNMPADYRPKSHEKLRTKSAAASKESSTKPSVDQAVGTHQLIIVPNPTNDKATVTLKGVLESEKLEVSVFDNKGQLMKKESKKGPSFTLSFANLVSGTYLVVVQDGTTQYSGQIAVNH
ncbi:MAG: TonB family protein [Bacteroidota bacterium]|nr:TonB family protein [Bacteroidota bacterium]